MDLTFLDATLVPLGMYALEVPMPGPGLVVISRASMVNGASNGAAAALGITASVAICAVATILGISALLMALPWLTAAIQICGGAYLAYLGIGLLHSALMSGSDGDRAGRIDAGIRERLGTSFRRGFIVGLGNPKIAAFFFALVAPAMSDAIPLSARLFILGGVILIDLFYHQTLAQIASRGRGVVGRVGKWFDAVVGGSMVAFGCALIVRSFSRP